MTTPAPKVIAPHPQPLTYEERTVELLIEQNKYLKRINEKLSFFVWIVLIAIAINFLF